MKPVLVSKENNEAKFTLTFTAEEFDAATLESYKANKDRFVINGFRRGKAPRSIIEKQYGEGVFFEDAIDNLLNKGYTEALDTLKIEPIDRPDVDFGNERFEKGKGFTATITVAVVPEITVKDYKGVKIERNLRKITAKDVQAELESRQKRNSRLVTVEREAQKGDTVILDYAGFCGEDQFEGGTAESQSLVLGSNSFIPGFEDQLIGVKAGEEKDVNVTFPKEYHEKSLAGKDAVFKCRLHEVKMEELPAIDDEFAKDISEFDTLKELKADIKKTLEAQAKDAAEYEGKNKAIEAVVKANEFTVPAVMVDDEAAKMLEEMSQQMQYQGLNLELYCQYLQKTPEELKEELKPEAEARVRSRLVVEAVADAEGLAASEEEIEKEYADMAKQYGMEVDKLKEMFDAQNAKYLAQDIKNRKAVDFIYANAVITEAEEKTKTESAPKASAAPKKETAAKKTAAKKTAARKTEKTEEK